VTLREAFGRYWRIPVVALLAGVLAFVASFAESKVYTSQTRLLIVEGSTTLLNSSGQPISNGGGSTLNASALAQTLAETQAGLASSREVATMVVDELHLDRPQPSKSGPIHSLEHAAASAYAHLKGWLTSGSYVSLPPREKAIQNAEKNITASDLAPTGGPDTGQADSFILELSANGDSALKAQQTANTAANALITVSRERFQHDSQSYVRALNTQLNDANLKLAVDNQAVTKYEVANSISSIQQQLVENIQSQGTLASQVVATQASVQGDQQAVTSLQAAVNATTPTQTSDQSITTGRSTTVDATTQANPVYEALQGQLTQAQATLAGEQAKEQSLQQQEQGNPSSSLTEAEAGLLTLEQGVTADQNNVQTLNDSLLQAEANVQISPVELTRLGTADLPTYPTKPKRYLFLLIGLILGGLAGAWLTYRARRRRRPEQPDDEVTTAPEPLTTEEYPTKDERRPVPVGANPSQTDGNGDGRDSGDAEYAR
jgi:uncharacterized protein involved in exopolysaccharide biosynthesis